MDKGSTGFNKIMGRSCKFKCRALGNPKPNITWYKGDQPFIKRKNGKKIKMRQWTLKLDNLDFDDSGRYKCVATNLHGEVFEFMTFGYMHRMIFHPSLEEALKIPLFYLELQLVYIVKS